jgi:hypothetical protein
MHVDLVHYENREAVVARRFHRAFNVIVEGSSFIEQQRVAD